MKAFLLAGGRGTRLRPFTDRAPKCLAPIDGVPLLSIWLDLCAVHGVSDVLLNVSHHAAAVEEFLSARHGPPNVQLVFEPEPRGSAGTLQDHRCFIGGDADFLILYADTLTDINLSDLVRAHRTGSALLTMALFASPDPSSAGIVELDSGDRVIGFQEKPARPSSRLANAGVYAATTDLLDALPHRAGVVDLAADVFPGLVGRMRGYRATGLVADIGTPTRLAEASLLWAARHAHRT